MYFINSAKLERSLCREEVVGDTRPLGDCSGHCTLWRSALLAATGKVERGVRIFDAQPAIAGYPYPALDEP